MLVPPVLNVPDAHYAAAKEVVAQLQAAGYQALLAGGCVRDRLLGHTPHDYDVVTSAPPEQVMALFPHTVAVGAQFGVVRVLTRSYEFEVATFRSDGEYRDGRRPVQVVYADPRADAARRDFTINALFYDPVHDQVLDYVDGQKDLQARVIRAVGEPAQRFREDHLRPLRAVRLAAQLGFRIEPATYQAVQEAAPLVRTVSGERIRDELNRILTGPDPAQGFRLLQDTGLLAVILPEVAAYAGVEQTPDYHPEG
ncbi:MAG: CCA tRNA nucleotidyltransferase, partial [Deinococcus sp.]|nr:CCA tRNA nucleotidyltransferase [Deinococcus sp.]